MCLGKKGAVGGVWQKEGSVLQKGAVVEAVVSGGAVWGKGKTIIGWVQKRVQNSVAGQKAGRRKGGG